MKRRNAKQEMPSRESRIDDIPVEVIQREKTTFFAKKIRAPIWFFIIDSGVLLLLYFVNRSYTMFYSDSMRTTLNVFLGLTLIQFPSYGKGIFKNKMIHVIFWGCIQAIYIIRIFSYFPVYSTQEAILSLKSDLQFQQGSIIVPKNTSSPEYYYYTSYLDRGYVFNYTIDDYLEGYIYFNPTNGDYRYESNP